MLNDLTKILACPSCGKDLALRQSKEKEGVVVAGQLVCTGCAKEYPITKGIPRFVSSDMYTNSFSFEWKKHSKTQLDSYNNWDHTEKEFQGSWPFDIKELSGKLVLDCGCGMGRFAEIALKAGAEVVGTDLSYAIDVARENLGSNSRFTPVQADIFHLPFKKNVFDYVYSFGVLHHTPDARAAFQAIVPHLKPGGGISINVYSEYNKVQVSFTKVYRLIVRKIGIRAFWYICYFLALLYFPSKIGFLRKPLLAVAPFRVGHNYSWTHLETFDWYSPHYMSFHSHPEVDSWFYNAGLHDFRVVQGQVGFFGRKPS
jgi:SAM-dependent methyltransferase